jgi:hypothetical protein
VVATAQAWVLAFDSGAVDSLNFRRWSDEFHSSVSTADCQELFSSPATFHELCHGSNFGELATSILGDREDDAQLSGTRAARSYPK